MRRVVAKRTAQLLQLRRRLRAQERLSQFQGFEFSCLDTSGESFPPFTFVNRHISDVTSEPIYADVRCEVMALKIKTKLIRQ